MTDVELREFIAGLGKSVIELRESTSELRKSTLELRKSQEETDRRLRQSGEETDRRLRQSREETDRQLRQTTRQLGELGNKFGSFAEGMALPSMEQVLYRDFGMHIVLPRATAHSNGRTLEIDVLAHDIGDRNEAYVVEVKSHLTSEGIDQILKTIEDFPKFFPNLGDRKVYGILAAVDIPRNLGNEVLKKGLYLARISDDTFILQVPPDFKPKAFNVAKGNGQKKNGAKPTRRRKER